MTTKTKGKRRDGSAAIAAAPAKAAPAKAAPAEATPAEATTPEHAGSLLPHVSSRDVARDRGRLDIAPQVVERIAEGAARRVPGVRAVSRRLGDDRLPVTARVLGDSASLHVQIAVGYPSPVRETCRAVRQAVTDEVGRLAGVTVTRLDLQVEQLQHRPGGTRRVR